MNAICSVRGVFVLLACLFFAAPIGANEVPTNSVMIMSYNIHHGRGVDGVVNLERIAAVIRDAGADVVALQEVDRGVQRTQHRDLPEELAKLTGMYVYFDKNIGFQGGDYGNAILSRHPFLSTTNLHYHMLHPNEQRGLQMVEIDIDGRVITIGNTHIDFRADDSERLQNVQEIRRHLETISGPVIVCGDFNDFPDSRVHQSLSEFLEDAWDKSGDGKGFTFSSTEPNRRIDYIWYRSANLLLPLRAWTVSTEASDHLPVVAEFILTYVIKSRVD